MPTEGVMEQIKWKDIKAVHHGAKVSVQAKSTPKHPLSGEGPIIGHIICKKDGNVSVLQSGDVLHSFAWYWEVTFI